MNAKQDHRTSLLRSQMIYARLVKKRKMGSVTKEYTRMTRR